MFKRGVSVWKGWGKTTKRANHLRLLSHTPNGKAVVLVVVVLRVDVTTGIHVQVVAVVGIVDGRRPPVAVRADIVQRTIVVVAGVRERGSKNNDHNTYPERSRTTPAERNEQVRAKEALTATDHPSRQSRQSVKDLKL